VYLRDLIACRRPDSADLIQERSKLWLKAAQRPLTDQDDGVTQW
jgi:hypothetical protein